MWPELPKLPTTFSDVKDIVGTVADTAESAAGTVISKLISSFNDFAEVGFFNQMYHSVPCHSKPFPSRLKLRT